MKCENIKNNEYHINYQEKNSSRKYAVEDAEERALWGRGADEQAEKENYTERNANACTVNSNSNNNSSDVDSHLSEEKSITKDERRQPDSG